MTKTILVPTDFSENAFFASQYACKLATKNGLQIELFHCYTTTSTVFDEENDTSPVLKADLLIVEWKEKLSREFPSITIETSCVSGLLTERIPQKTEDGSYVFVVMGTTGAGKGKPVIWGSNTSSIVSKSSIPVLAIPNGYDTFRLDNIAMLTNFKAEELETLNDYVTAISTIPRLTLIHVYKDQNDKDKVADSLQSWSFNIKEINGIESVHTLLRALDKEDETADSVPEVIQHIVTEQNYDMIVVTKTRKSFFERLFRTSVSKQIALHLNRPAFFDNN
ncbi:universal stress protein [Sphingobacterium sp. SGG-5]|uniref:universal stress protein n=1 Tax=Sphingobacterium sp. SGG-5 TaxID=2710881 RepID=UPI0013EE05D4|nr:universal stress protein [Sphingobacterium sp. SGG-5]NGM62965.1 universal stress protein [Sphingobacterium sp. SGG-5]